MEKNMNTEDVPKKDDQFDAGLAYEGESEIIEVELVDGKIPDHILDKYLSNNTFRDECGKEVSVGHGEFKITHKYIEVAVPCMSHRHRFLVNKLFDSVFGYATNTMTDLTSHTLPMALKFYRDTIRIIKDEKPSEDEKTVANFRISSILNRYVDPDLFIKNLKDFFADDFHLESFEIYLNTVRGNTYIVGQKERFRMTL
jgi:hypothetical protein